MAENAVGGGKAELSHHCDGRVASPGACGGVGPRLGCQDTTVSRGAKAKAGAMSAFRRGRGAVSPEFLPNARCRCHRLRWRAEAYGKVPREALRDAVAKKREWAYVRFREAVRERPTRESRCQDGPGELCAHQMAPSLFCAENNLFEHPRRYPAAKRAFLSVLCAAVMPDNNFTGPQMSRGVSTTS